MTNDQRPLTNNDQHLTPNHLIMPAKLLPRISLNHFTHGSPEEKDHFVKELGNAFHQWGFVIIREHGIGQKLINRFYQKSRAFFELPKSAKEKYEIKELAGQRGYTSFGTEHAKGTDVPDLKEFFQIGQEVAVSNPDKDKYPDNIHVSEVSQFTETGMELYQAFEKAGKTLLQAIALFLELPEHYFDDQIREGNSILRSIYYPPIQTDPKSAVRAEKHEDINLITLLVGASAGGLQLLNQQGEWMPVLPNEDEIAINVGDMLSRLTNDYLKSTTHRVINPPREEWNIPRLSIPFFLHPIADMDLTSLPQCLSDGESAKYEPTTAGKFLEERLRQIGLKK